MPTPPACASMSVPQIPGFAVQSSPFPNGVPGLTISVPIRANPSVAQLAEPDRLEAFARPALFAHSPVPLARHGRSETDRLARPGCTPGQIIGEIGRGKVRQVASAIEVSAFPSRGNPLHHIAQDRMISSVDLGGLAGGAMIHPGRGSAEVSEGPAATGEPTLTATSEQVASKPNPRRRPRRLLLW